MRTGAAAFCLFHSKCVVDNLCFRVSRVFVNRWWVILVISSDSQTVGILTHNLSWLTWINTDNLRLPFVSGRARCNSWVSGVMMLSNDCSMH